MKLQFSIYNIIIIILKMKKYQLKNETLSTTILQVMIQKWISLNLKQQNNKIIKYLKGCIYKLSILQDQIIKNAIKYIIYKIMPWIFDNFTYKNLIIQNNKLKQIYRNLLTKEYFRSNNNFQIFIIYLVKINSLFLEDNFQNILIDKSLESQICIMLYYTFLGIEITTKTYEVLEKKYIKSSIQNKDNHANQAKKLDISAFTSKSIFSLMNQSQKYFKVNKKLQQQHKNRFEHRLSEVKNKNLDKKEDSIQFGQLLKATLHVDQLPKLKQQKINLKTYQRVQTLPQQSTKDRQYQAFIDDNYHHLNKQINTNQLSQAIKSQSSKPLYFQLYNKNKNIKFNQSFHNCNNYSGYSFIKNKQKSNKLTVDMTSKIQSQQTQKQHNKMSYPQWNNIISTLKEEVYKIKKKNKKFNKQNYDQQIIKNQQCKITRDRDKQGEQIMIKKKQSVEEYGFQKLSRTNKKFLKLDNYGFQENIDEQRAESNNPSKIQPRYQKPNNFRHSKRLFLDECNNRKTILLTNNIKLS